MHFRRQGDILLTLQERCSRLTLAQRLNSKDATDTADAIIDQLAALPSTALQTITHDNGGEFARHERVKDAIGLPAFFCDPHSPWQRGGIENERQWPPTERPAAKGKPQRLQRRRHRRHRLESQCYAAKVSRLQNTNRGIRLSTRCRT